MSEPPRVASLAAALTPHGLAEVLRIVEGGGVLAIPTDTVYGLAADPFSEAAVERVFELKGREGGKAVPVLAADLDQVISLGVTAPAPTLEVLSRVWPARLTAVLPIASPIAASAGQSTLAVRVPAHAALRELLSAVGPLVATSANLAGQPPAVSAEDVVEIFGSRLDLVLDGGPSVELRASTLVDLTTRPARVLRSGPHSWVEVTDA